MKGSSGEIRSCAYLVPRGARGLWLTIFSDPDQLPPPGASPGQPALAVVRLLPVLRPLTLALLPGVP